MPIIIVVAIVAMVGGGVAAQQATPGDVLYPVKVEVNEKIGASLQFSAEAKAEYEAELAARRLEEAAELAAEGELDAEAEAEVETRFHEHSDAFKEMIAEVEAEGEGEAAAEITSRFEAALEAHSQVLVQLNSKDKEAQLIESDVRGEMNEITALRMRLESKVTTPGFQAASQTIRATEKARVLLEAKNDLEVDAESNDAEVETDASLKVRGDVQIKTGL